MIWKMIYNTIGIAAIFTGFQVASLFNAKIRQGILARKTAFRQLEEQLELAERKVATAASNPATGSGTPYLDADGVVGASIIAGAIFGGIATTLFVKGRSGRYAAYGRG